ncbi:unnamed protein product [Ambrosiozyma monospora]|uniref:Unnamed protein product n=1 Tax=Ambrosiozyma monospora TaxID=43982 RepID=A0ACB5TCB2_AMBMO|nr:unnamed protein product [Ambrosiozyma monospora]
MDVPINLIVEMLSYDQTNETFEKFNKLQNLKLRICVHCKRKLFHRLLILKDNRVKSEFTGSYDRFNLLKVKFEKDLASSRQGRLINEKSIARCIDSLNKMEQLSKKISAKITAYDATVEKFKKGEIDELPIKIDELRITKSLNQSIIVYLQDRLPVLRKLQQEKLKQELELSSTPTLSPVPEPANNVINTNNSILSSGIVKTNPKPKMTKRQIRECREKLMVLNEQKFIIENQYNEFKRSRKFDDMKILEDNLKDLTDEIALLEDQLGDDGF